MRNLLPRAGAPAKRLLLSVERELTHQDIFDLATGETEVPKTAPPTIQRLKATHHAAARFLAAGKNVTETAILVGRTPQRIGDLTRDPAFQELMAYYKDQVDEVGIDDAQRIKQKLLDVAEESLDEMTDRLEDPEKRRTIPFGELRQAVALGADRTVAPPKTAQPTTVVPAKITFNIGTRDIRPKDGEGTITIEQESGK
jgi:hypothetical protein